MRHLALWRQQRAHRPIFGLQALIFLLFSFVCLRAFAAPPCSKHSKLPGCPDHAPYFDHSQHQHSDAVTVTGRGHHTPPAGPSSRPSAQREKPASRPATDTVRFTTTSGTWMHTDLSPDGKRIVFDMLGDLYTVAVAGGQAKRLTKGPAYDQHPRWSPDGKSILFTSDRSGRNESWLLHLATKKTQRLTNHKWKSNTMAIWSPDGQYIVYRLRTTDSRSIGVVELRMVHILGGKGIQLTSGKRIGDANDPAFSPDGRYLYMATRGRHRYGRNPHAGIWNLYRLELSTGKKLLISRNASAPQLSSDGKLLSLVRRLGNKTAIYLHDLRTGQERVLTDNLDQDQHEGFAMNGTYPHYSWTPDNKALIYPAKGHFWRVEVSTGKRSAIRFKANVEQTVTHALRVVKRIGKQSFQPRIYRWPHLHPAGQSLVWTALGQIWSSAWPKVGKAKALFADQQVQRYAPHLSRDGKKLAFVTWSDLKRGHVWQQAVTQGNSGLQLSGKATQVTKRAGYYVNPAFSPDGKAMVYVRGSGTEARGLPTGYQPWLQIMYVNLETGKHNVVTTVGGRGMLGRMPHPHFAKDGKRIFFTRVKRRKYRGYTTLKSIRPDGTDERAYLTIYAAQDVQVSPDQRWVLFQQLHQVYLAVLPIARPKPLNLGTADDRTAGSKMPILRLSKIGGGWPTWGPNNTLVWSLGHHVYTAPLSDALAVLRHKAQQRGKPKKKKTAKKKKAAKAHNKERQAPPKRKDPKPTLTPKAPKLLAAPTQVRKSSKANAGSKSKNPAIAALAPNARKAVQKAKAPKFTPTDTPVPLPTPVASPKGCFLLKNLEIVTMRGKEILAKGHILVKDNRIQSVEPASKEVSYPAECKVFDLKGHTATPGFVDVHAHLHYKDLGVYPQNHWQHYVNLAYGVTTVFDPSAPTQGVFALGEAIRAGRTVGPRVYSTGFILYGAENTHKAVVYSLKQARHHLLRMKRMGAIGVKSYMQPTRQQRQWVMQAAREAQLFVVPEGGGNLSMNMSMVLDGHTGIEHALPIAPLYRDVIQLFARSHTGYTPTLLVAYGGMFGEAYFFQSQAIWNDPKLKRFMPQRLLDARGRRLSIYVHDNDWYYRKVAASADKIVQAGGKVQIGSHGQLQGLGYHWEMKALGQGGMSNHHVLRAATLHGAYYIGLHKDIGSLEAKKLADIAIFRKSPVKSLDHLKSIRWVIKNGEIFEAATMNRLYPSARPRPRFFWQQRRITKAQPH